MMELLRMLFGFVWDVVNFPLQIDGYTLRIWYFVAFGVLVGLVFKFYGIGGGDE